MARPGLGRRYAHDPRDRNFPMRPHLPALLAPPPRVYRYWNAEGWWGDQDTTPQCVAYAWTHWLEDGPVGQRGVAPVVRPGDLYAEAQRVDEWPGENYEGTSVRAGAKALQARGYIASYHWAADVVDIVDAVLNAGPVVLGCNWYETMFTPDEAGFLHLGGPLAGGHAFVLDGVNTKAGIFRMKNSWGRSWGRQGFAYLAIEDVDRLLGEQGEAALAIEIRK